MDKSESAWLVYFPEDKPAKVGVVHASWFVQDDGLGMPAVGALGKIKWQNKGKKKHPAIFLWEQVSGSASEAAKVLDDKLKDVAAREVYLAMGKKYADEQPKLQDSEPATRVKKDGLWGRGKREELVETTWLH